MLNPIQEIDNFLSSTHRDELLKMDRSKESAAAISALFTLFNNLRNAAEFHPEPTFSPETDKRIVGIWLSQLNGDQAKIKCPDNSTIEVTIPNEATEGKTISERFNLIMRRAEKHIITLCGCENSEPVPLP